MAMVLSETLKQRLATIHPSLANLAICSNRLNDDDFITLFNEILPFIKQDTLDVIGDDYWTACPTLHIDVNIYDIDVFGGDDIRQAVQRGYGFVGYRYDPLTNQVDTSEIYFTAGLPYKDFIQLFNT